MARSNRTRSDRKPTPATIETDDSALGARRPTAGRSKAKTTSHPKKPGNVKGGFKSSAEPAPRNATAPRTGALRNGPHGDSASGLIDERIRELGDWRGQTLALMRALILEAEPAMIEETKWGGTPVWSHDGIVCTGESYAKVVKLTFAHGASLDDPSRLFNSSLGGNTRRASTCERATWSMHARSDRW